MGRSGIGRVLFALASLVGLFFQSVRGSIDLMRIYPKHVTTKAFKQAHYDFVSSHVDHFGASRAAGPRRDLNSLIRSHQEAMQNILDTTHPDHNAPHRFVLNVQVGAHETLRQEYGDSNYHIINHKIGLLTLSVSELNELKARHSETILDFTPLLPELKIKDSILNTCYDYQKAKGETTNGTTPTLETLDMIENGQVETPTAHYPNLPLTQILVATIETLSVEEINGVVKKIETATQGGLVYAGVNEEFHGRKKNYLLFSFDGESDPTCSLFATQVVIVSALREVQWIERQVRMVTFNRWAKGICQTGTSAYTPLHMRQWIDSATTVSLNGEGQIVGVTDTGLDMSNCYFYDPDVSALSVKSSDGSKTSSTHRKVVQYYCSADCMDDATEAHGTHVAGTVAGYATKTKAYGDFVKFNGVAPLAKLAFFDIGKPSGDLAAPGDVNLNLLVKQYNVGARIFSWSWGCKATKISSDCGGAYLSNSEQTDKFLWEYPDSMVFIANGNTGASPEGVASTVGAPATAKSCVSVGASMTETNVFKAFASSVLDGVTSDFDINSLAFFSSRGPCHDDRVKPEVTAPGWWVTSAAGEANSTTLHCTIKTLQGTSMATPATAGNAALIRQYFTKGFYPTGSASSADAFNPSGALIKATLIHGAQTLTKAVQASSGSKTLTKSLTGTLPTSDQGYGRIQLDKSLSFKPGSSLCANAANCPPETAGNTHTSPLASSITPATLTYFVWGSAYRSGFSASDIKYKGIVTTGGNGQYFYFTMPSSVSTLTVTLVWTDYFGTATSGTTSTSPQLKNPIDVKVEGPCTHNSGTTTCTNAISSSLYDATKNAVNPHAKLTVAASGLTANSVYRIYVGPWVKNGAKSTILFEQPFALVASLDSQFSEVNSNMKPYLSTDMPFSKYSLPGAPASYISSGATTMIAVFSVACAILGGLLGIIYFSHKQAARLEDEEIAQRIGGMMAAGIRPQIQ